MQTFLPFPDFEQSARALDSKRLGKQRVEVIQIVRALTRPGYGWANHPAVLMWKGYEEALARYGVTCCEVWLESGFGDTCAATIVADVRAAGVASLRTQPELGAAAALPPWLGDADLHRSHQSSLVRKDAGFYGARFPGVPPDLAYLWPVRSEKVLEAEQRKAARAFAVAERQAAARRHARSVAAKKAWVTRRARRGTDQALGTGAVGGRLSERGPA